MDFTQAIKDANTKFMAAFAAKDLQKLSELYTEDCKLMPPGSDVVYGREAIKNVFGGVINAGAVSIKLEVDEVGPLGADTLFERSHYTFYKENGEVMDVGKFVVIWKQIDGQWYLYTDIFNSNRS